MANTPPYDLRNHHGSQSQSLPNINELQTDNMSHPLSPVKESPKKHPENKEIEIPVISMQDFQQVDMNEKLDLLMSAINKINTNFRMKFQELEDKITDEHQGLGPRLIDVESNIGELRMRMDNLEEVNAQLKYELTVIKGLLQVTDNRVINIDKKVVDLTARSMSNNIVISGITGDQEGEDEKSCKQKVLDLLKTQMRMELDNTEVIVAHRSRGRRTVKPRLMIVRCTHSLRQRIFQFTKNLKGV